VQGQVAAVVCVIGSNKRTLLVLSIYSLSWMVLRSSSTVAWNQLFVPVASAGGARERNNYWSTKKEKKATQEASVGEAMTRPRALASYFCAAEFRRSKLTGNINNNPFQGDRI
jgi:hypothetical protein